MELKYWLLGLLVWTKSTLCESGASTSSSIPPSSTNILGDYNRALDKHVGHPLKGEHRKLSIWKRNNIPPEDDDPPAVIPPENHDAPPPPPSNDDFDPSKRKYDRWLRPPHGPHQVYGCQNKARTVDGLSPSEIKVTGRYMMWQLENSQLIFKSQSTDPGSPCFPVFCYAPINATVSICNHRDDIEETVTLYGYDVGRMVWEMGVAVELDSKYLRGIWENGRRICTDPESQQNAELISQSYVTWTSWSEDKWEVMASRDAEGCGNWRGDPNWVTTGNGTFPEYLPLDVFT
ncbi:hypothetical protein TWF730_003849 [Orbilia blumenaviensis]|uniref:Uncharacterized protein n=1 Tax=Orbilia blumenaviensis TaxID=1796055 RepID=A0AAV9U1A0_9PEZI